MGISGIGIWQLLIILLIVVLLFGTKRLKTIGTDLGGALKSFRRAMDTDDEAAKADKPDELKHLDDGKPDAEFAEQKDKTGHA
jgi:sec-independent protein translocase protein TatA